MNYAELSVTQHQRAKEFSKAQTDAMVSYCGAERDLRESQSENAKLREALADLWPRASFTMCPENRVSWLERLAELGVEVDA